MTRVASLGQTLNGLQKIERTIIDEVRERQVPITAANFIWNYGRGTKRRTRKLESVAQGIASDPGLVPHPEEGEPISGG